MKPTIQRLYNPIDCYVAVSREESHEEKWEGDSLGDISF